MRGCSCFLVPHIPSELLDEQNRLGALEAATEPGQPLTAVPDTARSRTRDPKNRLLLAGQAVPKPDQKAP